MSITQEDRRILRELQQDGKISNVELARRVNMSESPCLRRTKALEDSGVIKSYQVRLDAKKLGYPVTAYILVNLDQRTETDANRFFEAVRHEPRIVECVAITGPNDLMLRVVARDIDDLSNLTMEGILRHPSVKDIASCIVLKHIKEDEGLPI